MIEALRRTRLRLGRDERGASLVEYCLLVALIALVCVGALTYFGSSSEGGLENSGSCIRAAYAGETPPANC